MKNVFWLVGAAVAMAGTLVGMPAFSQSTCTNCGCKYTAAWTDLVAGRPRTIQRSCQDASGTGSAQFISDTGQIKTYHLIADLKKVTHSGFEKAEVALLNNNGQTLLNPGVDTDTLAGAGHRRDQNLQLGSNFFPASFKFLAGRGYSAACNTSACP